MIRRLIDIFTECRAESISVVVNEHMTEVRSYLENLSNEIPLNLVVKTTPSSMHSFYEVSRSFTHGKFILTTVDTIFRPDDFKNYVKAFEADNSNDGYMAVTPFIDDEKPLYVATSTDGNNLITGFLDRPEPGVKYVSGGIYGLTSPALATLTRCIDSGTLRMRNYQRALIADGLRLKAWPIDKIIDVDHPSDIATARAFLQNE